MIRKFIVVCVLILFVSSSAFAADEPRVIRVTGEGLGSARYKSQTGLYKICAYRVARMDAFAKIAEELVKSPEQSASPSEQESSEYIVRTSLSSVIKGALQIGEPEFFDDGICKVTMKLIEIKPGSVIRVIGFGIGPTNLDKQDNFYKSYARQTARMDALRNLSETISGIEINSNFSMSLDTYELKSRVIHDQKSFKLIKESARQVGEAKFSSDGICEVIMEVILPNDLQEIYSVDTLSNSKFPQPK